MFEIPKMSDVAMEFFAMFARMEYALTRVPEFRRNNDGRVEPDWNAFVETAAIRGLFSTLRANPDANEIIDKPPKQRLFDDHLPWGPQPPPCTCMKQVCRAMKNARNNLFHGEKGNAEQPREQALLKAGICIMNAMLEADNRVAQYYYF